MPTTQYRGYELYSDTAAPDLSASGEYNKAINAIDSDMHEEIEARIGGDTELGALIDSEASSREDADTALNAAIAKEREERTAADTAESEARTAADNALGERVTAEVAAEANERKAADTALGERITAENTARTAADAAIRGDLTLETQRRTDADTALGKRIDNAEVEISANSADLTGIKGLTYGKDKQVFLENDNGQYSSPALEEIQHEIEQRVIIATYDRPNGAITPDIATIYKYLRNGLTVLIYNTADREVFFPDNFNPSDNQIIVWTGLTTQIQNIPNLSSSSVINHYLRSNAAEGKVEWLLANKYAPYWGGINHKPFSTIGSGLKVVSNALTVDTAELPSGESGMHVITLSNATDPITAATIAEIKAHWPNVCVEYDNAVFMPDAGDATESDADASFMFQCTSTYMVLLHAGDAPSFEHYQWTSYDQFEQLQGSVEQLQGTVLNMGDITFGTLEAMVPQ